MDTTRTGGELAVREPAAETHERLRLDGLPTELGVLLVVAGIGGILLPGPVGTPFLIAGGVVLWPSAFRRLEICVHKRFPRFHREGMKQMKHFITDLERRYPWTT